MTDDFTSKPSTEQAHDQRHVRRIARGWWFFAAVALFYLLADHQAHLFGILPYLLLLACPFMHFFMHRQHGGHGPRDKGENGENEK